MRILAPTSSYPLDEHDVSGRFVADWADGLSPFAEIDIVAPPDSRSRIIPASSDGPIRVHRFNHFSLFRHPRLASNVDLRRVLETSPSAWLELPFFHLEFLKTARRLAAKADVVCSHWLAPAGVVGSLAARGRRIPHVVIEHSGGLRLLERLPGGLTVLRQLLKRSAGCAVVSAELRERILVRYPEFESRVRVFPMGIDFQAASVACVQSKSALRRKHKLPEDKSILLFLGRHVEIKGLPTVLRAIAGRSNVSLVVAGDGPCRSEWEREAAAMNSPARFVGEVRGLEKWEFLAATDALVVPSLRFPDGRTEGAPVVCLEALSVGTPVVASSVGGLPEHVRDGDNGLLLPPDDAHAWRRAIERLTDDPELLPGLTRGAATTGDRYDRRRMGREFAGWLTEITR